MKTIALIWNFMAFSLFGFSISSNIETLTKQDFEADFIVASHPDDFLPGWSANQVRSGKTRVFQAEGEGITKSKALSVQTTGTFNAQIYIKTLTVGLKMPTISFWAKTNKNGSGNRPVRLWLSFSSDLGLSFSEPVQIGTKTSFPNENTAYQEYSLSFPDSLKEQEELTLKLEVNYGDGSGSAARFFLDNFSIEEAEEQMESLTATILPSENDSTILIEFDQKVILNSKTVTLNNKYGQAYQITQVKENQLLLRFDDYLFNNNYQLIFKELKAVSADTLYTDWTLNFDYKQPTPLGAIIINELMPDPNPKGQVPENPILPNAEFIELYNRTDKAIKLDNFTYNEAIIPQVVLDAQAYLILCSANEQHLFQPFGEVAGMDAFKTLVNGGGEILLRDGFGNLIDSLIYDPSLYKDSAKENGGWSMERINPFLACNDPYNWKASQAPEGGTPGEVNDGFSEAADQRVFEVLEILPLSSQLIQVTFSKTLPPGFVTQPSFLLNGQELKLLELTGNMILLEATSPMISGENYALQIHNLLDCYELPIKENVLNFTFDGSPPRLKELWGIDEKTLVLIFDEAIDPNTATNSENYEWLRKEEITAVPTVQEKAPNEVLLSLSQDLALNENYGLILTNIGDLSGNTIGTDSISFYWEDVLDTIMVHSPNTLKVIFTTVPGIESAIDPENYLISPTEAKPIKILEDLEEEKTFLLVFDKDLEQNQEQHLLLRGFHDKEGKPRIGLKKAFVWDTRSIALEQVDIPTNQSLLLTFNKALDPKWALLPQVYLVTPPNEHPQKVEMTNAQQVLLHFASQWNTGEEYQLNINGLEDLYGGKMSKAIGHHFTWDTLAPLIDTTYLLNPYELEIQWSKKMERPDSLFINKQLYTNYEISEDGQKFTLSNIEVWPSPFLEINIPMATSTSGEIGQNIQYTIDNRILSVGDAMIWDAQSIRITFTKFHDPGTVMFREQYQIQGEAPLDVIEENPYQVRLALKMNLRVGDQVDVMVNPIQKDTEMQGKHFSTELVYEDGIHDLWLENNQLLIINHDATMEGQPWLNDFYFMEEEYQLEPFLNQSYNKQIQVLISPPLPSGLQLTLNIPPRLLKDNRTLPGSLKAISWNPLPPELLEVVVLPENQIALYFDKALDPILAIVPQFYSIGDQIPQSTYLEEDGKVVLLTFGTTWTDGTALTLNIQQLEDLNGNEIVAAGFDFVYKQVAVPGPKDLLINELMPAPREGGELPTTEYIEIFNATDSTFNLGGIKLTNTRTESVLPRGEIKPGEYVILCPPSSVNAFANYGKVIGLNPWPALLNGGDQISIFNQREVLVDKMSYGPEIPLASEVLANGYSLELINPWSACEGLINYSPSSNEHKGTPGAKNSVFDDSPDRIAPQLLKAFVKNAYQIVLQFSKPSSIDSGNVSDFIIYPAINIKSANKDPQNHFQWLLNLEDALQENQSYEITVDNWRDCSGNAIARDGNTALIKIPGLPEEGDIVLNEILFNPPVGAPKFVEIYNNSSKLINLKNWKLANLPVGEIDNRKIITSDDLILDSFSYLVLTNDSQSLSTHFPKAVNSNFMEMSLPSYPIRSGTVILLDPEENWAQRFDYDEDYHHGFLRDAKGISLERYATGEAVNDPNNWHSAAAAENFATPGYKNSQVYDGNTGGLGLTISPEVFVPDAAGEQPFTTISYKLNQPNYQATLRIFTPTGLEIKLLCQNEIWAANGFYTWDGTNESGEKVGNGYYIISAELIHPNGHVQHIKKTVVVGTKF